MNQVGIQYIFHQYLGALPHSYAELWLDCHTSLIVLNPTCQKLVTDPSWRIRCLHDHICINLLTRGLWFLLLLSTCFMSLYLPWVYLLSATEYEAYTVAANKPGKSNISCFNFISLNFTLTRLDSQCEHLSKC